jgi:hypothetical protein
MSMPSFSTVVTMLHISKFHEIIMNSSPWSTSINSPTIEHKYQVLLDRLHLRLEAAQLKDDRRLVQQLSEELIYIENQL